MIFESPFKFSTNATKCIYSSVVEALQKCANETPERKVLISAEDASHFLTFSQLLDQIRAVECFFNQIGFGKDQVASVVMPNNIEIIPFYLGVLGRGGVFSGMSPMLTEFEIHRQLADSATRVVFTTDEVLEKVCEAVDQMEHSVIVISLGNGSKKRRDGTIDWNDVIRTEGEAPEWKNDVNDVAVLPYSSGTTGMPKGVMLTHFNIMSAVLNMIQHSEEHIPGPPGENAGKKSTIWNHSQFLAMPCYHISGKFIILGNLLAGSTTVLLSQFDLKTYLETVEKYSIWNLVLTPAVLIQLVKDPIVEKYDLSSLGYVTCGAAPLGAELAAEFAKKYPSVMLTQIYAMSECLHPFLTPCDRKDNYATGGCVSPGYQAKIVDLESGEALGENETGELLIRGPSVMKGYLNRPEATEETIDDDGWLHTGDIGYINTKGELFIVDRKKEMIKVNGLQVAPAEIESVLASDPRIRDVGVVGIPNSKNGEIPGAFIVKGDPTLSENDVQRLIQERVSRFKWPEGVIQFVDSIPKNPSGKILRRQLRLLVVN